MQGRGSSASDTTMRKYEFDNIFGPDSTQQQIYEEVNPIPSLNAGSYTLTSPSSTKSSC